MVTVDADDETATGETGAAGDGPPGVEAFQQVALEAVRAARAMLDAAESMIRDPATLESVISTVAGVARSATGAVVDFTTAAAPDSRRGADPSDGEVDPDDPAEPDDPDEPGGYESIPVH